MILRDPRRPLLFSAVLSWICVAPACGSASDDTPPVSGPSANGGVAPTGGQPASPAGGSVNGGTGGLAPGPTGGVAPVTPQGGAAPATTGGAAPSEAGGSGGNVASGGSANPPKPEPSLIGDVAFSTPSQSFK